MKTRTALLLAAAILFAPVCLPAQVQLPDTPAAHQLSAWLAAFDSGDRATIPLAPVKLTAKWVFANRRVASI
jgi:hypothetical protein